MGEADANPEDNRKLLRFLGQAEEDWPCGVHERYACFKTELEKILAEGDRKRHI